LFRAIDNGFEPLAKGRPRLLSEKGINHISSTITDKSIHLNSVKCNKEFYDLMKKEISDESCNSYGENTKSKLTLCFNALLPYQSYVMSLDLCQKMNFREF
jgi:hypothetical protein